MLSDLNTQNFIREVLSSQHDRKTKTQINGLASWFYGVLAAFLLFMAIMAYCSPAQGQMVYRSVVDVNPNLHLKGAADVNKRVVSQTDCAFWFRDTLRIEDDGTKTPLLSQSESYSKLIAVHKGPTSSVGFSDTLGYGTHVSCAVVHKPGEPCNYGKPTLVSSGTQDTGIVVGFHNMIDENGRAWNKADYCASRLDTVSGAIVYFKWNEKDWRVNSEYTLVESPTYWAGAYAVVDRCGEPRLYLGLDRQPIKPQIEIIKFISRGERPAQFLRE